jgi:hypothetical protein
MLRPYLFLDAAPPVVRLLMLHPYWSWMLRNPLFVC